MEGSLVNESTRVWRRCQDYRREMMMMIMIIIINLGIMPRRRCRVRMDQFRLMDSGPNIAAMLATICSRRYYWIGLMYICLILLVNCFYLESNCSVSRRYWILMYMLVTICSRRYWILMYMWLLVNCFYLEPNCSVSFCGFGSYSS